VRGMGGMGRPAVLHADTRPPLRPGGRHDTNIPGPALAPAPRFTEHPLEGTAVSTTPSSDMTPVPAALCEARP
jgi:hypothetical protein